MNINSKTEVRHKGDGVWQLVQPIEMLAEPFPGQSFVSVIALAHLIPDAESIALRLNFLQGFSDEELRKQGHLQTALDKQYAEGKHFGYAQTEAWIEGFDR